MGNTRKILYATIVMLPTIAWGQTLYTPQGTEIPNPIGNNGYKQGYFYRFEEYTSAQKAAIKEDCIKRYPRAVYWGEATTTYNCHAYAWHITEGGENVWINQTNIGGPSTYISDGSYIGTSQSDPEATKVSYPNGDHSAIIPYPLSVYFISKWGASCLMKHSYNNCPYNTSGLRFYKLSTAIFGEKVLRIPDSSNSVTAGYTLTNVPKGGVIEWKISPNPATLSGQGTNKITVSLTNYTSISAVVRTAQGSTLSIPEIYVKASKAPIITDIDIYQYCQSGNEYTLSVVTNQPYATYYWSVTEGTIHDIPYPGDASFIDYPNIHKAVTFSGNNYHTISVYGQNGYNIGEVFSKEFRYP